MEEQRNDELSLLAWMNVVLSFLFMVVACLCFFGCCPCCWRRTGTASSSAILFQWESC